MTEGNLPSLTQIITDAARPHEIRKTLSVELADRVAKVTRGLHADTPLQGFLFNRISAGRRDSLQTHVLSNLSPSAKTDALEDYEKWRSFTAALGDEDRAQGVENARRQGEITMIIRAALGTGILQTVGDIRSLSERVTHLGGLDTQDTVVEAALYAKNMSEPRLAFLLTAFPPTTVPQR